MSKLLHSSFKASTHSISRMKKRAKLKTAKKRKKFVIGVFEKGILLSQIPRIEEFKPFINYMKTYVSHNIRKGGFRKVYLYLDYFVIVGCDGVVITILKVDSEYKGIYGDIKCAIARKPMPIYEIREG